jgi:hypothetical protein
MHQVTKQPRADKGRNSYTPVLPRLLPVIKNSRVCKSLTAKTGGLGNRGPTSHNTRSTNFRLDASRHPLPADACNFQRRPANIGAHDRTQEIELETFNPSLGQAEITPTDAHSPVPDAIRPNDLSL